MQMQEIFDALSTAARVTRAKYHLTLAQLKQRLEDAPPGGMVVIDGIPPITVPGLPRYPTKPASYRGYYADLAFGSSETPVTVQQVLAWCLEAARTEYTGYKGGTFWMDGATPLWISEWGDDSARAIVDAQTWHVPTGPVTEPVTEPDNVTVYVLLVTKLLNP